VQVSQTQADSLPSSARPVSPTTTATSVDFQSFLRLLTAQLRNQDPLAPLESTQFVTQLANFSTVEQLVSANARLDQLADSVSSGGLEDYAAWIDRVAEIEGAPIRFNGAPAPFTIGPQLDAASVSLIVRDQNGSIVHRQAVENNSAVQFWNGAGGRLGELFTLEAEFTFGDEVKHSMPVNVFDVISAVRENAGVTTFALLSGLTVQREAIRGLGRSGAN
jgi:flagellar basal-body rod modification protein FlgD